MPANSTAEPNRIHPSSTTRRDFLSGIAGSAGLLFGQRNSACAADAIPKGPADVTLRIAPVQLEVVPGHMIQTTGYNGVVPGPLIRFREGAAATVDIFNDTDAPEFVHWHGFEVGTDVDGAEEEGSPGVPAHGHLRYRLTPSPAGFRYVHTHAMSMGDLNLGTFNGQFGFAWVEPRNNPGRYDQEVFLATHEWQPFLAAMDEEEDSSPTPPAPEHKNENTMAHAWEVRYRFFTINGKCLGYGEPIRVKEGQRVLFHILNASATENVRLALPGHRFQVIALDGNPVPHPAFVDVLELATAERIDAIVTMNSPGVFVLGSPMDKHRAKGMGIVVEYANRTGEPRWVKPPNSVWNYALFGENRAAAKPDQVIPLVFCQGARNKQGFESWTINGNAYDPGRLTRLAKGRRYRLVFDNQSEDNHPVHLHRSSFELTNISGTPTAGIKKDVVMVKSYRKVTADVTPMMEGLALFHCHQQLHMDFGFKMLFDVA
jgi:FtsP/CotA-like multicopper oxidase with cupredoxin domain